MELRTETATLGIVALLVLAAPVAAAEFPARHDHWRRGCAGLLHIEPDGISFSEISNKKPEHQLKWTWADIQQLEIGDGRMVRVLSYHDRPWLAGKDQPFDFYLDGKPDLLPVYELLRTKLDQRFVARLADMSGTPLWQLPVKELNAIKGTQGTLAVFDHRVVYQSSRPWASRTWRDSDLESISTAGPFQLTVRTLEKNGTFEFQLRQPLPEERYQALWLRLNRPKGLSLISESKENQK
ncbi:MAG: hypothetical protein HY821_15225 [Acidobacteria bacterium]|nr:hypothetical protein [Acidobacteriota bacterium]